METLYKFLTFSLVAFAATTSVVAQQSLVVDLGYASYRGFVNPETNNTQFMGIRYARNPTGKLRWKAPQEPPPIPGILDASVTPPACLNSVAGTQPKHPYGSGTSVVNRAELVKRQAGSASEDCLFLNVYVPGSPPVNPGRTGLPVVVWIHGGGYVAGSANNEGNDLIAASGGNAVVVHIQYRLGLFGFLAGSKVKVGGTLNAGLLDQQFALQWIQRHIRLFGGDSSRVTIWGESAGAGSVLQHIVANGGKTDPPLFANAITSSTFLPSQYEYNSPIAELLYNRTVTLARCDNESDTLSCLRNLDVATLQSINREICGSGFQGTFVFVPVVDGTFIQQRPSVALSQGKINGARLLAVTNTYEGRIFVNPNTTDLRPLNYVTQLFPLFGQSQVEAAAELYAPYPSDFDRAGEIMGESIFTCPTYLLLKAFKGRAYKGYFGVPPANHAGDVAYYFPSNGLPAWNNLEFRKAFSEAFLSFAVTGDPNAQRDPKIWPLWRRWSPSNQVEMVFNRTESGDAPFIHPISTSTDLRKRCDFWESVSELAAQ